MQIKTRRIVLSKALLQKHKHKPLSVNLAWTIFIVVQYPRAQGAIVQSCITVHQFYPAPLTLCQRSNRPQLSVWKKLVLKWKHIWELQAITCIPTWGLPRKLWNCSFLMQCTMCLKRKEINSPKQMTFPKKIFSHIYWGYIRASTRFKTNEVSPQDVSAKRWFSRSNISFVGASMLDRI